MKFFANLLGQRNLATTAILACLCAGCAATAPAPAYHSASLRINSVPNPFTAQLAALEAPKIEEELNKAFIADGRFKAGTGLFLSVEPTSFLPPRQIGAQRFPDRLGTNKTFLPGILVVAARWHDSSQKKLEEVQFEQDIIPIAGEISNHASINRAITDITRRIMLYTTSRYLDTSGATRKTQPRAP